MSPQLPNHRNRWTDPDASPEIGSLTFLLLLGLAVVAAFVLGVVVTWAKTL